MNKEGYGFANFMKDLRENFLESRWARKIYRAQIKRPMATNERFIEYTNQIIYYNIILKATDHHSNDAKLHETLTHQMSEGLTNKIEMLPANERNRICEIENINIWMREVETIDRTWKAEVKTTTEMMTELLNKRNREENRSNTRNVEYQRTTNEYQRPKAEHYSREDNRDENRYHPSALDAIFLYHIMVTAQ